MPRDAAAAEAALKSIDQKIAEVAAQNERLNGVESQGKALAADGHPQTDAILGKVDQLQADRASLAKELADCKKQLEEARNLLRFNVDHQEAADFLANK